MSSVFHLMIVQSLLRNGKLQYETMILSSDDNDLPHPDHTGHPETRFPVFFFETAINNLNHIKISDHVAITL